MDILNLGKINNAPESGLLLAYLRDAVVFEKYASIDSVKEKMNGKNILEIHLFDNEKEYRAISSTSKRFSMGVIEEITDFNYSPESDSCFKSEALLNHDEVKKVDLSKISVINHLSYDENGTVTIDNYRLIGEA